MNFNVTILTAPDPEITLKKEINLLKVALLYSDKITLISPTASMLLSVMQMHLLDDDSKFELVKTYMLATGQGNYDEIVNLYSTYKNLKTKKRLSREELLLKIKLREGFEKFTKSLSEIGEKFYNNSNFDKLVPLIEKGFIEFKHFNYGIDDVQEFFMNEILDVLNDVYKYPLFDNMIEGITHAYSIENNLSIANNNPKEIKMGKEVLFKLPNIEELDFIEIIELKNNLNIELSRFKGALLNYSNSLISLPYSEKDDVEIFKKYEYYIKPELADLKNQISQNKFIKKIRNELLSNSTKYATQTMVCIGLCELMEFNKLISTVGFLGESMYKTFKTKADESKKIKKHPLFFYHSMEKLK